VEFFRRLKSPRNIVRDTLLALEHFSSQITDRERKSLP
jgi:hypothetical protein